MKHVRHSLLCGAVGCGCVVCFVCDLPFWGEEWKGLACRCTLFELWWSPPTARLSRFCVNSGFDGGGFPLRCLPGSAPFAASLRACYHMQCVHLCTPWTIPTLSNAFWTVHLSSNFGSTLPCCGARFLTCFHCAFGGTVMPAAL